VIHMNDGACTFFRHTGSANNKRASSEAAEKELTETGTSVSPFAWKEYVQA